MSILCCGLPLRTGSFIVGAAELFGHLFGFLFTLWGWWLLADEYSEENQAFKNELIEKNATAAPPHDLDDETLTKSLFALAILGILYCFGLICAVVLLIGVKLSSTGTLKTWVGVKICLLILMFLHYIMSCHLLYSSSAQALVGFITGAILLCSSFYFIVVILVHTRMLREEKLAPASPSSSSQFVGETKGVRYEKVGVAA